MTTNQRLTERFISTVPLPVLPVRLAAYPDDDVAGLELRVTFRGIKAWTVRYRTGRHQRRLKLGRYPGVSLVDARKRARKALVDVDDGKDPAAEKEEASNARTWSDLGKEYLATHAQPKKRSWKDDRRRITRKLDPRWGHTPLEHITRKMVSKLVTTIAMEHGQSEAKAILALVSKMLNFAFDQGWLEANPAARMAKPGGESSRSRVLSDGELVACWDGIAAAEAGHLERAASLKLEPPHRSRRGKSQPEDPRFLHPLLADYLRLRLLLLQRGTETIEMRWEDLDLADGWWDIPGAFTKNKQPHRVPLTAPALAILRRLHGGAARYPWVFWNDRGTGSRCHRALRIRLGMITGLPDLGPRDLRRTGSTTMGKVKVPRLHISLVLNHVDKGPRATKVYDRYAYDTEKGAALSAWTDALKRILGERLTECEVNDSLIAGPAFMARAS